MVSAEAKWNPASKVISTVNTPCLFLIILDYSWSSLVVSKIAEPSPYFKECNRHPLISPRHTNTIFVGKLAQRLEGIQTVGGSKTIGPKWLKWLHVFFGARWLPVLTEAKLLCTLKSCACTILIYFAFPPGFRIGFSSLSIRLSCRILLSLCLSW